MAAASESLQSKTDEVKHKAETASSALTIAAQAASTDLKQSAELKRQLDHLSKTYHDYMATQKNFTHPVAHVSIDETNEGIETHIDVVFNKIPYHFESIKAQHTDSIYKHLHSQQVVMEKFGAGKVRTKEETKEIVDKLSALYAKKNNDGTLKPATPYSGLVVTDADTQDFLGVTFFYSPAPGKAETVSAPT